MKLGKILKGALTLFAVYKANEEELKPIVKAVKKKVVGKKKAAPN